MPYCASLEHMPYSNTLAFLNFSLCVKDRRLYTRGLDTLWSVILCVIHACHTVHLVVCLGPPGPYNIWTVQWQIL